MDDAIQILVAKDMKIFSGVRFEKKKNPAE